jgi:hypothetical protein
VHCSAFVQVPTGQHWQAGPLAPQPRPTPASHAPPAHAAPGWKQVAVAAQHCSPAPQPALHDGTQMAPRQL